MKVNIPTVRGRTMDGLKYLILTYGCQKNKYDSEVISAILEGMGYHKADDPEDARIVLLNTCCVRDNADQKVYGRLGQLKRLKSNNKELILAVTGCLAQKDGEDLIKRFPHLDIVLGTHNLDRLELAISEVRDKGSHYYCRELGDFGFDRLPVRRESSFSAWIPVSEGCDCHCTFCIVPTVRGRMKSRPVEKIVREVEDFVKRGGVEVTLLGQNVNSYGLDFEPHTDFAGLLKILNRIEDLRRIRYTSPHPGRFTLDCIQKISTLERVCEQVHLPLQAGDDQVLKRMGRSYTAAQFKEVVKNLREWIPGIAITTDIITGFPGESPEQFENTLRLIDEIQFDSAFMFAYSERNGTAAVLMKEKVPERERLDRLYRLVRLQNDITYCRNRSREGDTEEVLVECVSKKNRSFLTGRTRKNKVVNFEGKIDLIGEFKRVKLEKAYTWGFIGVLV